MQSVECVGGCLCGGVRYRVTGQLARFTLCHCGRCRKATGSEFTSNIMLAEAKLEWTEGQELVRRYKVPEAKRYSTAFCGNCGSSLPRSVPEIGLVAVPAGSVDGDPGVNPQANIFWDSRAQWLTRAADLPTYGEYPPGV